MEVIALRGAMNTGKSLTINIVYNFLLSGPWIQVPGFFRILGNPKYNDVFDILIKDDSKLGILGMGDYQRTSNSLASLLKEQETNDCDIVICACRANLNIEKAVSHYANHVFVDKTIAVDLSNYLAVNQMDADKIIRLI